jgi:saccharopine dehydrogenase-like NADP-dependent oxidoreductase
MMFGRNGNPSHARFDLRRGRIDVSGNGARPFSNLSTGVSSIVAADANPERLTGLKQSLPDSRLQTRVFDVNDRGAIQSLLADCDVCINGVPTFAGFQMQIFEACLQANRPYVDYGGMGVYTVRQKAGHDQWKRAGATAVIGLGSEPGLSNII